MILSAVYMLGMVQRVYHGPAALAVLLAESFRGRGERMPLGGLGLVRLVGAGISVGISAVLLWARNTELLNRIAADGGWCHHQAGR